MGKLGREIDFCNEKRGYSGVGDGESSGDRCIRIRTVEISRILLAYLAGGADPQVAFASFNINTKHSLLDRFFSILLDRDFPLTNLYREKLVLSARL